MDDETRKAFGSLKIDMTKTRSLVIQSTEFLLKLNDNVIEAFISLDKKIGIIDDRLDRIEYHVRMARKDIQTLPDIVSTLMNDGKEIAEIKAKVKKLEN